MRRLANAILQRLWLRAFFKRQQAYAARLEALAAQQRAEQAERRK